MISLLRIFTLYTFVAVGVLLRQHLYSFQNNNSFIMAVQAFTLKPAHAVRNPLKYLVGNQLQPMKVAVFFSSTKERSDAAVTCSNVESSIVSALEMSYQQPSDISNEQESNIVVNPSPIPMVVPIVTTTTTLHETTTEIHSQQQLELSPSTTQQQSELNIWAARGLLLLVAAIWGTNFAVRLVF
jgi:hypothetical protein